LAEFLRDEFAEGAGDRIHAAAGSRADEQRDRTVRPSLRMNGVSGYRAKQQRCERSREKLNKIHEPRLATADGDRN